MRNYDKAMELYRKVLEMNPNFAIAHLYLGSALREQGRVDEAIAEIQTGISLGSGQQGLPHLGYAYAVAGRRRRSRKGHQRVNGTGKAALCLAVRSGMCLCGAWKKDRAFEWLEKSYQEHAWDMVGLRIQPMLDGLRADPRFSDLVRRVGL